MASGGDLLGFGGDVDEDEARGDDLHQEQMRTTHIELRPPKAGPPTMTAAMTRARAEAGVGVDGVGPARDDDGPRPKP
jgi:hypothetical protein